MTFLLVFVAGMNSTASSITSTQRLTAGVVTAHFFSLPSHIRRVFTPDSVQVGLKSLGYGISVTTGATVLNWILTSFQN